MACRLKRALPSDVFSRAGTGNLDQQTCGTAWVGGLSYEAVRARSRPRFGTAWPPSDGVLATRGTLFGQAACVLGSLSPSDECLAASWQARGIEFETVRRTDAI